MKRFGVGEKPRFRSARAPASRSSTSIHNALLSRLREREPVSWLPALGCWLITRRDLALQAMRDPTTFTVDDPRFSTGRVLGPSMLTRDGSAHARHREPFARSFRLDDVRTRRLDPGHPTAPRGLVFRKPPALHAVWG
jgi:cytochrome P450